MRPGDCVVVRSLLGVYCDGGPKLRRDPGRVGLFVAYADAGAATWVVTRQGLELVRTVCISRVDSTP